MTLSQAANMAQQSTMMVATVTSKIADELVGSVTRSLQKLNKLIETRLEGSMEQERELLKEKQSFFAFAEEWFASLTI